MLEAIRSELGPKFANEQQRRFFESRASELLYSGAFGAGKSRILCEKALDLARRYPGAPVGIFRKVAASLAATTQLTFFRDVCPAGTIVRQNKTESWYELANGSRVWFLGLDKDAATGMPSKVGSLDLAFAFVDEAVELTESDWMMLAGRLRYPGVPWTQLAAATNPANPKHWLKSRFTPPTAERELLTASTFDNRLLPASYLERMAGLTGIYRERYVKGAWIAVSGGMFDPEWIVRSPAPQRYANGHLTDDMRRVVVAIDPAVTSGTDSDETGMVVVGLGADGRCYVLADLSCKLPPNLWAKRAVEAYHEYRADSIIAEVNNGGDLVGTVIGSVDANVPFRKITASRGKLTRALPVASLYGERKVTHVDVFPELESQMVSYDGTGASPDRLDALVWALTEVALTGYHGDTQKQWIA